MKKVVLMSSMLAVALLTVLVASTAFAHGDNGNGKAKLNGWEEVPSISTTGKGSFRIRVQSDGLHYVLRYEGLEGGNALFAHIHFADKDVNGGVIAFLCGGGDKPACPATAGTVEGVIDAADIVGPAAQGIEAGSLTEAIRALRRGLVYANVHSPRWPGGEIRGQVGNNGHNHRKDKRDRR